MGPQVVAGYGRDEVYRVHAELCLGGVDEAESQRAGHIRLPVGGVEGGEEQEAQGEHEPRIGAELERGTNGHGHEDGADRVAAVVE